MSKLSATPARTYAKGIGDAVADRTINRKITRYVTPYDQTVILPRRDDMALDKEVEAWCKSNNKVIESYDVPHGDGIDVTCVLRVIGEIEVEKWEDVADRVAYGNATLHPKIEEREAEFNAMHHHLRQASILMSGRHLQHGDAAQSTRNMEVFTNCLQHDTRILTMEYGPIEIGKIAGETVTVIAGDGKPRQAMIHEHGEQELFEITFRPVKGGGGKFHHSVTATENHRWILRNGDVTDALKVGDVIASISGDVGFDPVAVTHGVVFGDGSAHKGRRDHSTSVSAGRTYASIRVCKQDKVRDEICEYLDAGGYKFTTPVSASGDRVYYIGKFEHVKDVPFCNDPEYVAGFIYGWWLADGSKGVDGSLEISTANEMAANWLLEHSGYGGFTVSTHRVMERSEGDGSFANGKALHVIRLRRNSEWKVESIKPVGKAPVYCPEEPVTSSFVLANGLLTGNCSTAASTFLSFYLLLNGSGVGRSYDNDMIKANLNNLPITVCAIDMMHKDAQSGEINALDLRTVKHLYAGRQIEVFEVPDSREGWAKSLEKMEYLAFLGTKRDTVLVLDFSKVRPRGSPIGGMQGRPASGPGPMMTAISNMAKLRDAGMDAWRAAMYADHYVAECVLVGGARRAARMATKTWRDKNVLDFIQVKRGGFLWSSNNSVTVDEEFWTAVKKVESESNIHGLTPEQLFDEGLIEQIELHAHKVFNALCEAAYHDKTGEPGIISVDKLTWSDDGIETLLDGDFAESARYKLDRETLGLTAALAKAWSECKYKVITNPCVPAETPILTSAGYVSIGDVIGKSVEVWNGKEFSAVTPFATGFNPTVRVELSDGTELRCTPTHKFILAGDRYSPEGERREAGDLKVGDKLARYRMPVVTAGESAASDSQAYSQGFYSGDGNTDLEYSWLYAPKYVCSDRLVGRIGEEQNATSRKTWTHGPMLSKTWVPLQMDANYCLNWLAGLLDSDGVVCTDREGGQSFQVCSVDRQFLIDARLMLTRLGAQAKVSLATEAKSRSMPDGKGGEKSYDCKTVWRLLICNFDAWNLVNESGLKLNRLKYTGAKPNRSASRFVTVVAVREDAPCETFCFTEPKNHTGTFNGIVTGQCGEIVLGALGGYCVIADVVPYHATSAFQAAGSSNSDFSKWDDDAEDAFRTATRALIRTNLMDSLYAKEVKRTNRIGVGITGFHEYAWARFDYAWKEIVDEAKSLDFWLTISRFKRAVQDEAKRYSAALGVVEPHTNTTIKPAGCASLDTAIKTTEGVLTMRELFDKHGMTESDLRGMKDGTWIDPKVKTMVLDEKNVEREVTKLYLNGVKLVYEIEFEDGAVVKLTGNHKLKTVTGEWKRVDELTEADEILQF